MATNPNMPGEVHAFPALPPMPAVARILARYDRQKVEAFVAIAIDLLDTMDGNADEEDDDPAEADGDELDGNSSAEDEFQTHRWQRGAGCPIADPGDDEHDGREPEDWE